MISNSYSQELGKKQLLVWRNKGLDNRVGRADFFFFFF